MGEISKIAWTDATFNPWWGCARVSPGCEHCYAEQLATVRRKLPVWGVDAERRPMSEAYWREPLKWDRKAKESGKRVRVFCASMADVFEQAPARNEAANAVMRDGRHRLFLLIEKTPNLDWLLLTKRPENVSKLVPWGGELGPWPRNVWLGTTAEDQARYDHRWPVLAQNAARVHFISHDPALGPIALRPACEVAALPDWVITGGESGPGARPYELAWARSVVSQCRRLGIVPFVKQLGACATDAENGIAGRSLNVLAEARTLISKRLTDPKGGDPAEWPEELRVQEFPR